jgi:hypothetical protein
MKGLEWLKHDILGVGLAMRSCFVHADSIADTALCAVISMQSFAVVYVQPEKYQSSVI